MSKINLLDEDLINKIAAGEVIERPASVVKELIENSLDAGATKLEIEIKDSGKELIKVADNGEGMTEADAKKSILRHATSKISSAEDLFSIKTLGFRGEALASIAAVSRLSLTTKQTEELAGVNLTVEGGQVINLGCVAASTGTTIAVKNLFFNTPARKKFLKTDAVELRHIIEVVIRYALANPAVFFKLTHEGHALINSPAVEELRSRIASIYGVNLAKELLEVNYSNEFAAITGFVAKPYDSRNDREQQIIFVNGRWIKNNDIVTAAYDAYHSALFVNKHPVFILNLTLDPEKIDVNVHPQKSEIKIEQKEEIQQAVFLAIQETLKKNNLIPCLDLDFEQQLTFGMPQKKEGIKPEVKYAFEAGKQTEFKLAELRDENKNKINGTEINSYDKDKDNFTDSYDNNNNNHKLSENDHFNEEHLRNETLPPMKILGQVHKTFFVAETPGGMFIIDQHAAHERVLYEQFMNQFLNQQVEVQRLLQGDILEFDPTETMAVKEHLIDLKLLGFALEEFGEKTFIVKTVPMLLGRLQAKEIVPEIISKLQRGENKLEQVQEEIITRMACRAAVMAGDALTVNQMNRILNDLSFCHNPYTCPHGRPSIIKTSIDELEKKFRRK